MTVKDYIFCKHQRKILKINSAEWWIPAKKVPDLNCEVQDLSVEVVDLKQEVLDLRSGEIPPPILTPAGSD